MELTKKFLKILRPARPGLAQFISIPRNSKSNLEQVAYAKVKKISENLPENVYRCMRGKRTSRTRAR